MNHAQVLDSLIHELRNPDRRREGVPLGEEHEGAAVARWMISKLNDVLSQLTLAHGTTNPFWHTATVYDIWRPGHRKEQVSFTAYIVPRRMQHVRTLVEPEGSLYRLRVVGLPDSFGPRLIHGSKVSAGPERMRIADVDAQSVKDIWDAHYRPPAASVNRIRGGRRR
jgi:hypothetical protein